MVRKAGTTRRRLAPIERKLELLQAAERVMRRLGAAAAVQDVAREAGVSRGAFYLYFPSWSHLVLEMRQDVLASFWRGFEATEPHASGGWPSLIERLGVTYVDFAVGLEGLHEAVFHGGSDALLRNSGRHAFIRQLAERLQAGHAAGAFRASDADVTARLVFAVLQETVDATYAGHDRERALAAMREFLRQALAPPALPTPRAKPGGVAGAPVTSQHHRW